MLNTHHNDNMQNTHSSNIHHPIIKLALAALLLLTMVGVTLGVHNSATTPRAHAATTSSYEIAVINQVFGRYAGQALRVAECESSLNPYARNSISVGGSYAMGLFQVLYPSTWDTTSQARQSPYNIVANTKAAYDVFRASGYTWRQWVCQP